MGKEIWKDVKKSNGRYQVSNLSNIKAVERVDHRGLTITEKIIAKHISVSGDYRVNLTINGLPTQWNVKSIVATAFIPNPNKLRSVINIDGNKSNNLPGNLKWVSNRLGNSRKGVIWNIE